MLKRDYKETLNLPQTAFPMKANLPEREALILQQWQTLNLYEMIRTTRKTCKPFLVLDGPPYANGHIHVGHAVNKILKDIVVKSKTLGGWDAPFVPCWDCHGLPIELNVEKKHGKPGKQLTPADFRKACREYAASQVAIQRADFIRLGVIGDWEHPCLTMDALYEADIIRSIATLIRRGTIQQGYKPVYWCLSCASALSEAEVVYADKTSIAIDVRFEVVDAAAVRQLFEVSASLLPIHVPIWTTTPWSLPGNQAVAIHPMAHYVLMEGAGEQLIVAKALLPTLIEKYHLTNATILGETIGQHLLGLTLKHPFYDKHVPLIGSAHVTMEQGTGAVHIAPAHGPEDFILGKQYQLSLENPIADNGCYQENVPLFAGQWVTKAETAIVALLKEHHQLLTQQTVQHSYPHCWRHHTPVIYRATPQWFINMEHHQLRTQTLAAVKQVQWIPSWGEARIQTMIASRPDWCISRQRTWGVPLTLLIHKETGALHPETATLMETIAMRVEKEGLEAWFASDVTTWLGEEAPHYRMLFDVLDVWFDAGVLHTCITKTHPEYAFPSDLYLEGSDQHRGWFQSALLSAMALYDKAPYRAVLTHGFTVDGSGRKMSKSLGNVIAPSEITQQYGADVLRLWVASSDYRGEIAISQEILKHSVETYRRIRNTIRFFLSNLYDFHPTEHMLPFESLLSLDQWAIDCAYHLQQDIIQAYETYQFHLVVQKIHHFCVVEMGGFYLDVIKDRQYTMQKESMGRRSAQSALYHLIHAFLRWIAPVLSFTAEESWAYLPQPSTPSVLVTEWHDQLNHFTEQTTMNATYWTTIRLVRDAVNKEIEAQRQHGHLGSALEAQVTLYCEPTLQAQLTALKEELRFVLIVSQVTVQPMSTLEASYTQTAVPGLCVQVLSTTAPKCERCWHRVPDVNQTVDYPGLCGRCILNLTTGESRQYA